MHPLVCVADIVMACGEPVLRRETIVRGEKHDGGAQRNLSAYTILEFDCTSIKAATVGIRIDQVRLAF